MSIKKIRGRHIFIYLALFTLIIAAWVFIFSPKTSKPSEEIVLVDTTQLIKPLPVKEKYLGFYKDSIEVLESRIKRNQNVAEILQPYNIKPQKIHQLAQISKPIFDLRKINTNRNYKLILDLDSIKTAKAFVYEPNAFEFIVFNLQDSLYVTKHLKEADTVQKEISGIIYNSLYQDMVDRGASAELVNRFVDVFGWQVDFFRIQKEDKYKILYEEIVVDDQVVGIGKIHGGFFEHFNSQYYAVNFDQGKGEDFFDLEGHSLRKAFLRAPVEYTRISSRYSGRRFHPVLKRYKSHLGTDYVAPRGTPIRAVGDGVVSEARFKKYNGNYVKIRHNGTYSTQYLHMSSIAKGMRPGTKVKQGQTIGYVGSTGLATGNHVCYRFWKNGVQVDPLRVKIPPSEPILENFLDDYNQQKNKIVAALDSISYPQDNKVVFARIQ